MVHSAAVGGLAGECIAQGGADGMGGEMLHMGGQVEETGGEGRRRSGEGRRMGGERMVRCGDGKDTLSESSRLVKHHSVGLSKCIKIGCSFHQDTLTRSTTDACKECERHTDNQRTRAGNNQEGQCTQQPKGEVVGIVGSKQRENEGDHQCQHHYNRGIDTGKTMDECLALRLFRTRMFHQFNDFRHR